MSLSEIGTLLTKRDIFSGTPGSILHNSSESATMSNEVGRSDAAGGLGPPVWSIDTVTFDDAGSCIQLIKRPVWIWRNIS